MALRVRFLILFLLVVALLTPALEVFAGGKGGGGVNVKGYFRKDGTYVQPHVRSAPDSNPYNNYGFPGNYNPNTGRTSPGDPNRYLERYNERKNPFALPKTGTDD